MNLFDTNTISRFRYLLSNLQWVGEEPLRNVVGDPWTFKSTVLSVRLHGEIGGMSPFVAIEAQDPVKVRQVLDRFGWVYFINGADFIVAIGRYLRQPVAVPQRASGDPVVTAGADDTSKTGETWSVGKSDFQYPRDDLS